MESVTHSGQKTMTKLINTKQTVKTHANNQTPPNYTEGTTTPHNLKGWETLREITTKPKQKERQLQIQWPDHFPHFPILHKQLDTPSETPKNSENVP
jgi:hypothetical protein